jgi:hypothetical protein
MLSPLTTLKGNLAPSPAKSSITQRGGKPPNPLQGELGRSLLDQATERLTRGLEGAPYAAAAAAILQGDRPGSLAAGIGRGLDARLQTQLFMRTKPYELAREQAAGQYMTAQARQQELQNKIDQLNLGYMTAPWNLDGSNGGQIPASGSGSDGAPSTVSTGSGGAGGAPGLDNLGQLPLTLESQQLLQLLQAQYDRAAQFASTAPAARVDLMAISQEMAKVVQDDPLAKQYLANQMTKFNIEQQLGSSIKQKILDIGKESFELAQSELQSLSNAPNFAVDLTDPNKINRWIDSRAKTIFAERYSMLKQQLASMGINPDKYAAEIAQAQAQVEIPQASAGSVNPYAADTSAGPATGVAAVPVQGEFPSAGLTLPQATPGLHPLAPAGAGPAPSSQGAPVSPHAPTPAPSAPSKIPQVPAAVTPSSAQPQVPAAVTPSSAQPQVADDNPFVKRPMTRGENLDYSKEQQVAGQNLAILASGYQDLQHALELNKLAFSGGFFTPVQIELARTRSVLQGKDDPQLVATAQLQSILSGQTLQNLSTLIKGNPTEGERAYVERLGATIQMSRGERDALIRRVMRLIEPRMQFEKMRMDALAAGQAIDPNSYQTWLKQAYGPTMGARIAAGDVPVE